MANGKISQSKAASVAPRKAPKTATGNAKKAAPNSPPATVKPNTNYRRDAAGKF